MLPIYINGRFLGKPVTGVERFAREILQALDNLLIQRKDAPNVILFAPRDTPAPQNLNKISFKTCGKHQGHIWEQGDLAYAARKGRLISLCNCGPAFHPDHLVVIHDALVYRMPKDYAFSYRLFHRTLGKILARTATIGTVSRFSQQELSSVLGIKAEQILLIPNGHEHINRQAPSENIIAKLGLENRPFFLFIGSPAPRKNLNRLIEAFQALNRENIALVIIGAANAKVFKGANAASYKNVLTPGRLEDGEIIALYQAAEALVFPSLYEGFGIPPLEAMVHGCPVIGADIPPVREVCDDAILYVDPLKPNTITQQMDTLLKAAGLKETLIHKGQSRVHLYKWATSVEPLYAFLMEGKKSK